MKEFEFESTLFGGLNGHAMTPADASFGELCPCNSITWEESQKVVSNQLKQSRMLIIS